MDGDNAKRDVGTPNPIFLFFFLDMGAQSESRGFPSPYRPYRSIGRKNEVRSEECLGRTLGVVTDPLLGLSRNGGLYILYGTKN